MSLLLWNLQVDAFSTTPIQPLHAVCVEKCPRGWMYNDIEYCNSHASVVTEFSGGRTPCLANSVAAAASTAASEDIFWGWLYHGVVYSSCCMLLTDYTHGCISCNISSTCMSRLYVVVDGLYTWMHFSYHFVDLHVTFLGCCWRIIHTDAFLVTLC